MVIIWKLIFSLRVDSLSSWIRTLILIKDWSFCGKYLLTNQCNSLDYGVSNFDSYQRWQYLWWIFIDLSIYKIVASQFMFYSTFFSDFFFCFLRIQIHKWSYSFLDRIVSSKYSPNPKILYWDLLKVWDKKSNLF